MVFASNLNIKEARTVIIWYYSIQYT